MTVRLTDAGVQRGFGNLLSVMILDPDSRNGPVP